MHRAVFLAIAAAAGIAGACTQARSERGPTVERNYQVGNFDQIDVAGAYDVTVRTGAAPSVHARGDQSAIDRLVIEVRNGTLSIRPKERGGVQIAWGHEGKAELTVTVPMLRGAELAGSGNIRIDRVEGERFNGSIAGSGDLDVDQIEVGSLSLDIAGSGGVTVRHGRARNADYQIAGSGDIDAKGVAAETAAVSVAGSGDVAAQARNTASVSIMGSGDVDLRGGARCTVSKAGSGEARCS